MYPGILSNILKGFAAKRVKLENEMKKEESKWILDERRYTDKGDSDIIRYMCMREAPAVFWFIYYENRSKIGSTLWECILNNCDLAVIEPPSDGDWWHTIKV